MPNPEDRKSIAFDRPGNHHIRVLGYLDEKWSERLGCMRITAHSQMDQEGSVTELFGKVRDQAALVGLLNNLYELHLTLLSVEYISENKGGRYEKKISIRQSGRSAAVMA